MNLSNDFISNFDRYSAFSKPVYTLSDPAIVAIQKPINFAKNVTRFPHGQYKFVIRDATNTRGK